MPIIGTTITLSTTPTHIASGRHVDDPVTAIVRNPDDADSIFLGGSDVANTSYPVAPGESVAIPLYPSDELYALGPGVINVLINRQDPKKDWS